MGEHIQTERRGRVLIARLDNPPHALMNQPMFEELDALVRRVDGDDEVGAVVLTGAAPDVFLAHYDVGELLALAREAPPISEGQAVMALRLARGLAKIPRLGPLLERTPLAGLLSLQRFHGTLLQMGRSGTVFIAAINGSTAGGGLELALACDLRYLSDQGELAQPEALLGFPPGGGGTQRMTRLIGRAAALEIMLTGRALSAVEAERVGLVHAVVPHDDVVDAACAMAERLASRYKPAVSVIKRAVLEGGSKPLEEGLQGEQAGLLAMFGHAKVQAVMAAYVAFTERNGKLPAYDDVARQQLDDGEFSPFHATST
jgi:enoyl-CoA hydratase/carnithine racemase